MEEGVPQQWIIHHHHHHHHILTERLCPKRCLFHAVSIKNVAISRVGVYKGAGKTVIKVLVLMQRDSEVHYKYTSGNLIVYGEAPFIFKSSLQSNSTSTEVFL